MRAGFITGVLSLLVAGSAWAQSPQLLVKEGDKQHPVSLAKAEIGVQIAGQLAQTTMTLTFRNDAERVLEGELVFPLPENAAVCSYALDVNGSLMDAVTIEKVKARVVFETEVRKGIDPGIVEKVQGNNFRTRVYPIPAKGTRTIRVQYVSELVSSPVGALSYKLPLNWDNAVGAVSLKVGVMGTEAEPVLAGAELKGMKFAKAQDRYVAEAKFENVALKTTLEVALPPATGRIVSVEKKTRYAVSVENLDPKTADQFLKVDHYFVVSDIAPAAPKDQRPAAEKVHRMGIAWDASLSRGDVDHKRELAVIEKRIKGLGDVIVDVVVFRNKPEAARQYWVKAGDAREVLKHLSGTIYDGGTALSTVEFTKDTAADRGDRAETLPAIAHWLLFTDGLINLGADLPAKLEVPVYAITADPRANHSLLRHLAGKSGGAYVNLQRLDDEQAIAAMGVSPFSLLSVEYDKNEMMEVYPTIAQPVQGRVTVSGRLLGKSAKITLNYGTAGRVTVSVPVELKQEGASETGLIPRYWAQAKLAELGLDEEKNELAITTLGKEFNLVTAFTSMIVLERVEQYVEHKIIPPKTQPAMYAEFMKRIEQGRDVAQKETESKINRVLAMWKARQAWWDQEFKYPADLKFKAINPEKPGAVTAVSGGALAHDPQAVARAGLPGIAPTTPAPPVAMPRPTPTPDGAPHDSAGEPRQEALRDGSRRDDARANAGTASALGMERAHREGAGSARGASAAAARDGWAAHVADRPPNQLGTGKADSPDLNAVITIKEWSPDAPYLKTLAAAKPEDRYALYSDQAKALKSTPAFFLDCAEFFDKYNERELAVRILTNIPELGLDDGRLLRIAAHKLQQMGELDLAIDLFEKVAKLRPEEPQSFRDLGLALADRADRELAAGRKRQAMNSAAGAADPAADYARSLEMLHKVVMNTWQRFDEIEVIALMEANRIIVRMQSGPASTDARVAAIRNPFDLRLVKLLDPDLRIVLTWDTDNTDIDLHVVEPSGEECFYGHNRTTIGGAMSRDFTQGYGPEEYCLKRLMAGEYKIKVHFYGNRDQKLVGPTTVQATVITHYGRPDEKRQALTLRLKDAKDWVEVGSVTLKP